MNIWQNLRYGKDFIFFIHYYSNGVMLLLFNPVNNSIPMTIVNVHTGNPIMNIAYQGQLKDIEFVE
jgi:hypothetical protein